MGYVCCFVGDFNEDWNNKHIMPAELPPQFQKDFSGGVITNINENIVPKNSLAYAMNLDFDEELGSAVSRLGTGAIGSQLVDNNAILGLHDFRYGASGANKLLAAINASGGATSVVYDVEAGTTVTTGLTASTKMRFLTFLDSVLMINGADAERSYNGTTVITTGGAFDLANIPSSNKVKYCEEFLDRVYVAGDTAEPDRLYYSGVASSGAVSWTSGNGNVDIEPENGGGGITGLSKVPGYLLIFKERSMHRWNYDSAFPESLVDIGTPSQESVVKSAGLCAFFSASSGDSLGFYVTNGGRPISISHLRAKNIKKWVDAIPRSYHTSVSGWATETHFGWSVGDLTVDGVSYTNVVLRWSIKTGEWSIRSYPTEFKVFSNFVDSSGNNVIVGGDDDGTVIQLDKPSTYTDYPSTTPIFWELRTQEEDFDYNQQKEIAKRIVVVSRNAENATAQVYADGLLVQNMGSVNKDVSELLLSRRIIGNYFQFAIAGKQTGGRATIKELEIPNVLVLDNF